MFLDEKCLKPFLIVNVLNYNFLSKAKNQLKLKQITITCIMTTARLIPAQLTGKDFLCGSHFTVSNDDRFIHEAMNTTLHRDFVLPPNNVKPEPALPPLPSKFMHRDDEKINLRVSETVDAYPEKRYVHDALKDKYEALYKTNFKMIADKRIDAFQTTHDQHYKPMPISTTDCLSYLGTELKESHFPQGDREKAELPKSDYRSSYPAHDVPPYAPVSYDFWSSNTITGDKHRRFDTTNNSSYVPINAKPATPFPFHKACSIPEGDKEKIVERTTMAAYSYRPHIGNFQSKQNVDSHTKLYSTSFTLKDGHGTYDRYKSTTCDSYQPLPPVDSKVVRDNHRNFSAVPEGDLEIDRVRTRLNHTSTRTVHKHMSVANALKERVSGADKRTASNVYIGDNDLSSNFYSTTFDDTFHPVTVPFVKANYYPKSVVPLKYYEDCAEPAATASDFPRHDIAKHGASRAIAKELQATNIKPQLPGRFFSTTHNDQFVAKSVTPIEVDSKRLQLSSLPIGTLGKYIKGSNVVH